MYASTDVRVRQGGGGWEDRPQSARRAQRWEGIRGEGTPSRLGPALGSGLRRNDGGTVTAEGAEGAEAGDWD